MRVCTLASGSSGNSLFIESKYSKILVDAGISPRQILKRLSLLDVSISDIDAVVVTHEHLDHTKAITKLDIPVYVASETTHLWKDRVSFLSEFDSSSCFEIKDFFITPFSVPHDAIDPVGFTIELEDIKIGIVTDIGSVTGLVIEKLKNSNFLILESNHDNNLLLNSNYPWELKQRIKGRLGHLSNLQSSALLNSLCHDHLKYVVLAHLSEQSNNPEVAYTQAKKVLKNRNTNGIHLSVAPRSTIGEVLTL